jgi:hypothetical protein
MKPTDNYGSWTSGSSHEMAIQPSVLSPLDTPEKSIGAWAALAPDTGYTLGNLWQRSVDLVPPVWSLVQLRVAEVLEFLHAWAITTRVIARLLPIVIDGGRSCENLAAAVVFDNANLCFNCAR